MLYQLFIAYVLFASILCIDESCPLVVPIVNGVSLRHVITYLEYYYTNPMCEIPEVFILTIRMHMYSLCM